MDAVQPKSIKIPTMKVSTKLEKLGQKKSNLVELPKKPKQPGWYKKSATPGELGIATVVGYIRKSSEKPGVFAKLGKLDKGDRIMITRQDDSVATFKVDKIKSYPTKKFSADEVYGQSEPQSELRMITCGGTLKPKDPPSNVVVYAHLIEPEQSEPR